MTNYKVLSKGESIETDPLNAIFSAIYTPIVPKTKIGNRTKYNKNEDNFFVDSNEGLASITGNISGGLISKLKGYGIELSKE